ncbi:preprotein translocase subunit SecE [bacterium]|nr:preprotein translocase subunit SecE [bacterium]
MIPKELKKYSRYVALFFVFGFVVVAYYFSVLLEMVFQWMRWNDLPLLGDQFSLSTLIAVITVGLVSLALWTKKNTKTASFEIADELFNVDWPSKTQTKEASTITIVFSIVFALILASMDFVWSAFTSFLFKM